MANAHMVVAAVVAKLVVPMVLVGGTHMVVTVLGGSKAGRGDPGGRGVPAR